MRVEFANWVEQFGRREPRLIFLTGDLGFGALEQVRAALGPRFVNVGVSEQNMISVAAALAHEGLRPLCYSIAPFTVFRPLEQIRLDVALHRHPVKIVGNGGGYGYGIMGASHHAIEDLAVLSCMPGMACIVPLCGSDVTAACEAAFTYPGPAYIRLGFGIWPDSIGGLPPFEPQRRLVTASAPPKLTIVGLGPVLLPTLLPASMAETVDVFAIGQLPFQNVTPELIESINASGRLLVIEEHVARGGLGEHLAAALSRQNLRFELHHRCAQGYPHSRYGSQRWHLEQSQLDAEALRADIATLKQ